MVHLELGVPLLALYPCITLMYAVRKKAVWSYIAKIFGSCFIVFWVVQRVLFYIFCRLICFNLSIIRSLCVAKPIQLFIRYNNKKEYV